MSNQTIYINVGLSSTQDGNLTTMDADLVKCIVGLKFPHCDMKVAPYTSSWTDSEGVAYEEDCLAFKVTVPHIHAWTVGATQQRINDIRVLCKQEAVAFHTISSHGRQYREVHYGPEQPQGALVFDEKYFRYIS